MVGDDGDTATAATPKKQKVPAKACVQCAYNYGNKRVFAKCYGCAGWFHEECLPLWYANLNPPDDVMQLICGTRPRDSMLMTFKIGDKPDNYCGPDEENDGTDAALHSLDQLFNFCDTCCKGEKGLEINFKAAEDKIRKNHSR